ncbi:MAG TPA: MFS transporter [Conexibacter sp.]|nr:MFS transporter [Conexibacter sp.]
MPDERSAGLRRALALPGVAPLLAVASVARLHVGGMGLAVLLLVEQDRASLASAGAAVAALSVGVGLTRPAQGRLIDRCGMRCFVPLSLLHALAVAVLLATVAAAAPTAAIAAAAFALGFSAPSISVAVRAAISARVAPAHRAAVLGADTALQDGAFALGPLLAGAVAVVTSPAAALVVLVAVGGAGAVALAWRFELPRAEAAPVAPGALTASPAPAPAPSPRPLAPPTLRPILQPLAVSTALGVVYGALAVGAVAAVLERGSDGLTGPVTAAVFAGGVLGDLLIAPRRPDLPLATRLRRRLLALLALSAALVAVPGSVPLIAALLVVGAALAGASVTVVVDVAERAAPAARAEAFGWAGATLRLGNALGAGAAGLAAHAAGARVALLVAVGGAALAYLALRAGTIKTQSVSALSAIGVARSRHALLPARHETTSHHHRPLRDLGDPAGAGPRDR